MNYYLDEEFHEYAKKPYFGMFGKPINTIELISIGLVSSDGREYYAISKDFDVDAAWENDWLRENVLRPIFNELQPKEIHSREFVKRFFATAGSKDFTKYHLKAQLSVFGKTDKEIADDIKWFTFNPKTKSGKGFEDDKSIITHYPEFYAYYADYDWVVFCQLFGRMIDLPKGFPMYCIDLKQTLNEKEIEMAKIPYQHPSIEATQFRVKDNGGFEEIGTVITLKNHPNYPKQKNEHNALADARWNKALHEFLLSQ